MPSCQISEIPVPGGASTEVQKLKGSESQRDISTLPQLITLTLAGLTDLCKESGRTLIAFDDKIYDLSKWKGFHPGGTLAIDHMAGKDATEAIRAFHPSIVWTSMIERYRVGNLVLSADEVHANAKFYNLRHGFNELKLRLEKEGLFKPDTFFYQCLLLRYLVMFSVALALTLLLPSPWNAILGGTAVAALWQQLAFFAHDAGHSGVTYNRKFDMLLGSLAGSAFGGLSLAWWKSTHNVHHIICAPTTPSTTPISNTCHSSPSANGTATPCTARITSESWRLTQWPRPPCCSKRTPISRSWPWGDSTSTPRATSSSYPTCQPWGRKAGSSLWG